MPSNISLVSSETNIRDKLGDENLKSYQKRHGLQIRPSLESPVRFVGSGTTVFK
ncbi:hypothetical protein [Moorena bouillonii]|uniref:hypothetical protein n=1 Tax=Moorena bouillonii TaxID=207920 RepID=UPI001301676C|nr:hypothetical protein [Moorena bouillonii]